MIHNNLDFFNVSELKTIEGIPGVILQRYPKEVWEHMGHKENERGRFVAQTASGCEIRFVTDSPAVRISLGAMEAERDIFIYNGDFFHSVQRIKPGVIQTLHLERNPKFYTVNLKALQSGRFSPNVWRIVFGRVTAVFYNLDCLGHSYRPPEAHEVPKVKWLAYGSSITQGVGAISYPNSYVYRAAKHMGMDVLNKSLGGTCFCEKEVSHYLSRDGSWDFATMEIGINMVENTSPEEFEERAGNFVKSMLTANKPVILITLYPNYHDYAVNGIGKDTMAKFRSIVRNIHLKEKNQNLYILEGEDILTEMCGLTCDLAHPSESGYEIMGLNLANKIKGLSVIK